jgi:two-component system chemotaxis response regulator CheY
MKHVLVVDDSPVIRKVARRIMEGRQVQTAEAENGAQALAACAGSMPDAIFVDGSLTEMENFAVVRELRKLPGGDKPRIVVVVTENDEAQVARARRNGCDEVMLKPFNREIMEGKLAAIGLIEPRRLS